MVDPESELKEWAPLSELLFHLPSRLQVGLFFRDVKLTCVDVIPEYLVLGTNLGIVFWYDRKTHEIQKLKCENSTSAITVVKIISTVDYMVACGTVNGLINIFQIPKRVPDSIPESLKPKITCQIERYTVSELHKTQITALEWSKNGMRLFSGDKTGIVVLTELDFYMHLCRSSEILNESYEVVQLSYYQQSLLISTTYRSIICQQLDKWKVSQVGKKDRKVLGPFGGIFHRNGLKISDSTLYCTRPGLRIWISDNDGCVQQTLLFKELLNQDCPEVPLINPMSDNLRNLQPQKEACFGILLPFDGNQLVTYNNDIIYILNPKKMSVIATVSNLRRVLSVATYGDEIFILEGERSLIRLSYKPENVTESSSVPQLNIMTNSIKDLTTKLQASTIISAIPPLIIETAKNGLDVHIDSLTVINAEEAKESPPKDDGPFSEMNAVNKKFEIYNKIGEREFEDTILYKHHRRRRKPLNGVRNMSSSVTSLSSTSSEEKDTPLKLPVMSLSTIGILPDLRSPDSIRNDIEYKEKILADVLNFDKVKIEDVGGTKQEEDSEKEMEGMSCDTEESNVDTQEESSDAGATEMCVSPRSNDEFCIKPNIFPKFSVCHERKDDHYVANLKSSDTPACLNIPNSWKLENIQVQHDSYESSYSDASLADWEII